MDNPDLNPLLPSLAGTGIGGLLLVIAVALIGFVISAFITSLWVRLIIAFMRTTLDREYKRMANSGMR